MTTEEIIQKMPKIDLHCHLDGSIPFQTIHRFAQEAGVASEDPDEFLKSITAPPQCSSLKEYLQRFSLPVSLLKSTENLFDAGYGLIEAVSKENVVYIEVRFAPLLLVQENLSLDVIVDSVLQGLESAKKRYGVNYSVILCAMRNKPYWFNAPLLAMVEKYRKRGVLALDLAGDERTYSVIKQQQLFEEANKMDIPFTIHAGEAAGPKSIWDAVKLGAKRIGHGIAMKDDPDLRAFCRENKIGIELCPVSNIQTKAAANWAEYPFSVFLEEGLFITINTDNRTVSNTALTNEFRELVIHYGINLSQIETLYCNSVNLSFTDDEQKRHLHTLFDEFKLKLHM